MTHSLSDKLKSKDASASKRIISWCSCSQLCDLRGSVMERVIAQMQFSSQIKIAFNAIFGNIFRYKYFSILPATFACTITAMQQWEKESSKYSKMLKGDLLTLFNISFRIPPCLVGLLRSQQLFHRHFYHSHKTQNM